MTMHWPCPSRAYHPANFGTRAHEGLANSQKSSKVGLEHGCVLVVERPESLEKWT